MAGGCIRGTRPRGTGAGEGEDDEECRGFEWGR